jgi:hypothetical protein
VVCVALQGDVWVFHLGKIGWFLSTPDRRSTLVLQPHPVMTKEYITFGDNGKGRVLSVGTVKVSECMTLRHVSLVKSLGYNLLSVSQLLDEGFEDCFNTGCSCVLDSRGDLVCTIVPEGQIFRVDFFSVCWLFSLFGCWCFGGALEMA